MFDKLLSFWDQVMAVFFASSCYPVSFNCSKNFSGVSVTSSWIFSFQRAQFARLFAAVSLIGLSLFLFYQVYKLVHAFIGGFYE